MFSCIKFFFLYQLKWSFFSLLYSFHVVFYICWFSCVEPSLRSRDKSLLVMICNLCNMLLNLIYWYFFLRIFALVFILISVCGFLAVFFNFAFSGNIGLIELRNVPLKFLEMFYINMVHELQRFD